METNSLLMIIIAILLPPVAVLIERGFGGSFLLNILLTLLGGIPGMIHAVYVVMNGKSSAHA